LVSIPLGAFFAIAVSSGWGRRSTGCLAAPWRGAAGCVAIKPDLRAAGDRAASIRDVAQDAITAAILTVLMILIFSAAELSMFEMRMLIGTNFLPFRSEA
jgi:hypothetical protein